MKKLETPGHHLCQEASMFGFSLPFSAFLSILVLFYVLQKKTLSPRDAVDSENVLENRVKVVLQLQRFQVVFLFWVLDISCFVVSRVFDRVRGFCWHDSWTGREGNTAIYSIICFPSQSPIIDFKDKGTGSAPKTDESCLQQKCLPNLSLNSPAFHKYFQFY